MNELALVPIVFLTSALAAVMGMGGGILLIAVMPGLIPAAVILPLHAATSWRVIFPAPHSVGAILIPAYSRLFCWVRL